MKKVLDKVAKIGLYSAKNASSNVSWAFCYQPQEPEALKKFKK